MKALFLILFFQINIFLSRKIISGIKYIDQTDSYPTGCESVSTVMCLNYFKINITVKEFIDNYLDKGDIISEGNVKYGPDPNKQFVGSPYDSKSYGCYEGVIEKALNKIIAKKKLENIFEVVNLTKIPLENITKEYLDNDIPVIFWATINFKKYYINQNNTWIINRETGETFTWRSNEHCLLLIGYDNVKNLYYFLDPWNDNGLISRSMDLVERRHKEQYSMAVALKKK